MSLTPFVPEYVDVANPVIRNADLLSALETVVSALPTVMPSEPYKLWIEPPGGVLRFTGETQSVGSAAVGSAFVGLSFTA